MLTELRSRDFGVRVIGVVGSPDRNLEKIGNRHIRAHAAEGMLYRKAIEVAAERCELKSRAFSDRGFDDVASAELRCEPSAVRTAIDDVGRSAGRPWRADERAAATAAWIALV